MGKDKSRSKMKKGKKKKSFLDIQKKHKREIKRTNKDPDAKVDETRFKFQNFSDQVASVEASIVYQLAGVGTIQVDPDSNSCVFSETLTYWRDMNLTTQFQECDKKLSKFTSLTQVIFSQTDIVSILCDYLSRGSLLNIQPVLELTAALATDLQHEYYPHLEKVLDILIGGPLTIRDATVIKWSLRCLGHLLKILWKPISLNLSAVYNQCSKLFSYSKPDFIRYLGAETLSFLVRKCAEKEKFLLEILNFDKTTTDSKAISKLLFESIRTVNDQFNTHCQKLWPLYIEHLTGEKGDILEDITEFCAEHSSREFISPILGTLFDKIDLLKTDKVASTNQLIKCLSLLVKLKAGKLIKDTERFCTFFEDSRILEIASSEFLELVGRFLMADKLHLSKNKVDSIVSKVLSGEHFSLEMKLDLVSDFSDHPVFESSILRPYLVLVQSQIKTFQSQIITHLAQTIQSQVPSPNLGSELQDWEPFLLDLQMVRELRSVPEGERFTRVIVDQLSVENPLDDVKNALVCVGSLKPIKKPAVLAKLSALADEIISLQEKSSEKVALLPLIISTIVHIADYEAIPNLMKVEDVIELFLKNINDKPRIRALNFLISSLSVSGSIPNLGEEKVKTILVSLQSSLSSPDGDVRQLCLHTIMTLLPLLGKQVKKVYEENQISLLGVFETLLSAEQCAESLTSYKDKLNQLEKVDYARIARVLAENDFLSLAPVHHLLGLLYTNFTLMWSPLMDLLANYGNGMKRDVFWEVMGDKLRAAEKDVLDMINKIKEGKAVMDEKRIDYINYRNHLLDIVSRFPRVAEAKNRELVPLFLDTFMTEEYVEIRKLSEDKSVEISHKSVIQSTIKSLLSHLNIFVKFQDLKSLHRSSELRELVLNLLCHKLAPVQKLALEILIAYKLKFLVPYKENLLKLLDEKDFKAELIAFPLAGEDTPIKEEHRADFIPIILRILYGRLRAKKAGGKGGKGGKGTINARRGLILHHMMELSEDEMTVFFDLVFKDLFTGSNLGIGENVNEYILNGGDAVAKSSKQMQACIEMVQVIISKLGKLLNTSLTYILSVINWLGFTVQKMIDVENHSNLKSLRNTIYSVLANFYNKYTNYQFTETENQAVFQVFVWKMLENFESDFIHSSSGVLQLLMSWSKTQAYRPLFLLLHPTNNSRVLENVCKVLVKPSTNAKVIDTVLDIIHNLITEDDVMEVDDEDCQKEGALIVLKEMDNILAHFQAWLKATNENIRNLKKVGIKLDILATIAPHVTNPEDALIFFKQLIMLSNSLKKPETVLKVLTITKLLMIHIPNDKVTEVVTELIPLFGKLATRDERLELSLVIQNSSKNEPTLSFVSELCVELNSYDKRRVEEPDFERRMNIFKKIRDVAKEDTEMTHLELKSVIYNCCFFLKNETDSSLKANALEAINTITKVFKIMAEKDSDISKTLIDKICFGQIKTGMKNKDDSVRCDFISFLQSLITNCADFNPRLKDLSKLTDEDIDSNFLENMRHVQLHRRGRVMTKLASQLDLDSNFIKIKNLTQLVLPLAGTYLLTDSYAKNSDLVDQSIMLVGSIARCLPWPEYENSVKYYIELFTKDTQHQKQLVKITTAVLDAFHFEVGAEFEKSLNLDASKAEGDNTSKTKDEILKSKIFFTVNNVLLPKLHATLSGKTKGPTAVSDEDKLILRVPLAIPIIKMLKILSGKALFRQVPGIISKIVSFLRSKAIEIREAARSTLCSVMELLGPRYLSFVMKELSAGLMRGYQLHVLTFTTHSIMCRLADKDMFKPGDLDSALHQITGMALGEMFGIVAEEKEVRQITGKLMEARGTKSYDALQILAKFISNDKLLALAKPFADKAAQLSTFKNLQKIRECLRNIVLGLLENKELDPVACMVFVYGVTMDKLQMGATTVRQKNSMKVENNQSIFIVQRAPKRTGVVAKTSKSTSQHVVHEFGLSLLYFLLKRSSLLATEEVHCQRLEPFIEILLSFCSSSHVTLTTTALRCLLWLVKFPLKVLDKQKILEITNKVFELLNKFGGGTDGKGENHDLVIIASKLLVVLIRDVELTQLDQTHLKTILDYVVTDVMDPFKSTTAFGLLSAILTRKLETSSTELHDVMLKMVELSIQSNSGQTRQAARSTVISYVSNYNLKKKLGKLIDLYCSQLNYEMESGRLSASESLRSVISVLHPTKTEPHASFLFVSLAPHLINDDSTTCRKAVSSTLSALIKIVSQGTTETLLKCCLTWYATADNPAHNQLACHLLTIFMDTVGAKVIKPSLDTILSLLPQHITGTDHLSVQALHLFTRLVRDTNETVLPPHSPLLSLSWKAVHNCLLHSHSWVRLLSAQLVGLYLANTTPDQMKENMTVGLEDCWLGSVNTFKSLVLDSMEQLSLNLDQESDLGTQVVKNLVALVKVTLLEGWEEFMEKREAKVTFAWIMKKSVKVANQELISSPKLSSKRTLVFNLIAASCLDTSQQNIEKVLKIILPPLHRNLSTNNPDAELKNHCQEVLDLIKSKIDDDTFSRVYMEIQMNLAKKKGERAITKKQNLVLNPKLAAKRKIQQNEAKKKAKKAKYKN